MNLRLETKSCMLCRCILLCVVLPSIESFVGFTYNNGRKRLAYSFRALSKYPARSVALNASDDEIGLGPKRQQKRISLQVDHFYQPFEDEDKNETIVPVPDYSQAKKSNVAKELSQLSADERSQRVASHLQTLVTEYDRQADEYSHDQPNYVLNHLAKKVIQDIISSHEISFKQKQVLIPPEERSDKQPTLLEVMNRKETNTPVTILHIGCGTGQLFSRLLAAADELNGPMILNITSLDLSSKMCRLSRIAAEEALDDSRTTQHRIHVIHGDALQWIGVPNESKPEATIVFEKHSYPQQHFDCVIFDECLNNFLDTGKLRFKFFSLPVLILKLFPLFLSLRPGESFRLASSCLRLNGVMAVLDSRGIPFSIDQWERNPTIYPNPLPYTTYYRDAVRFLPLQALGFAEVKDLLNEKKEVQSYDLYYSSSRRVPFRCLSQIIRLRGPVASGYGRGGKKLGIPTANLPESLFADALSGVSTGVYFGWAVIEDPNSKKKGRNTFHKAVVNVGFSPTFEGKENREKIVEAHLMMDKDVYLVPSDFYNETMRLSLIGSLRPEKKFESFPQLLAAIHNDIFNAREALTMPPFATLRSDPFIADSCRTINNTLLMGETWIGVDGGDEEASWEFVDAVTALKSSPLGRWVA